MHNVQDGAAGTGEFAVVWLGQQTRDLGKVLLLEGLNGT